MPAGNTLGLDRFVVTFCNNENLRIHLVSDAKWNPLSAQATLETPPFTWAQA